jgi:pimeloyl-ACP methyl ester carboxylesterase
MAGAAVQKIILKALLAMVWIGAANAQPAINPIAKDVTVLTFKMHYLEAGTGKPVILLHGLGGAGSRWQDNVRSLSRDFHVFALDQIGFGDSDKPLANYHVGMLSDFLVEFMKAVGLSKASLVGNSMGAFVAAYTAVHYPDSVDRIVLADGAGFCFGPNAPALNPHLVQIMNGATRDETREFFRFLFHDKDRVTEQMVEENWVLRLRSSYAIGRVLETTGKIGCVTDEQMAAVKAPTLIVWGKFDPLINPANADRLERDIKGSRKVILENAGHLPQIEQADEFNRVVGQFLKEP